MHMWGKRAILHNIAALGMGAGKNPRGDVAQNGFRTGKMHNFS